MCKLQRTDLVTFRDASAACWQRVTHISLARVYGRIVWTAVEFQTNCNIYLCIIIIIYYLCVCHALFSVISSP